jgi:hypothetical protein
MLLCSLGLWSSIAAARYLGPTANGYSFHAGALPAELFMRDQELSQEEFPSTATLLVHVRDANREPVEGVPVTFQLGSRCKGVLTLAAQRAVTHNGQASVTLTAANTAGACRVAVRVDNVTQEVWVTVSNTPEDRW